MNPATPVGLPAAPPVSLSSRMSTAGLTSQEQVGKAGTLFTRSRTFDRASGLQPMAGSTCRAGDPSVYWPSVFVQRLQNSVDPTVGSEQVIARRLEADAGRLDLFVGHRHAGTLSRSFRQVVGKSRPEEGHVRRGHVLCPRLLCLVFWRGHTPTVAYLSGIWCHRWNRPGTWIHLAGF